MFEWIRGGRWTVVEKEEASATAYKACLEPLDGHLLRERISARLFLTNRPRWNDAIGQPAGLEVYSPRPRDSYRLLREWVQVNREFEPDFQSKPLEEWEPEKRARVLTRLTGSLAAFGPLWEVPGLINVQTRLQEQEQHRGVDLDAYMHEVRWFGEMLVAVEARHAKEDRLVLLKSMAEASRRDIAEVRVNVQLDQEEGTIWYEAQPVTLRAFLWQWLFGRLGRTPGVCRYCGDTFELTPALGRPPAYCPKHRGDKYRTAVYERRLPHVGKRSRRGP